MTLSAPPPPPAAPPVPGAIQPGPGVVPPFAAPPREGIRRRMWIGLGIGTAVAVLCGGGGIVGIGALLVSTSDAVKNEARATATDFFTAWEKQDYRAAYQLTCSSVHDRIEYSQFSARLAEEPVQGFTIDTVVLTNTELTVSVDATFDSTISRRLVLEMDVDEAAARRVTVCGGF